MDEICAHIQLGQPPIRFLYESARVVAFQPAHPAWQAHIVVASRKHITSLATAAAADETTLVELLGIVARFSREVEDAWGGCHIFTDTGNHQNIPHLHFVLCAGRPTSTQTEAMTSPSMAVESVVVESINVDTINVDAINVAPVTAPSGNTASGNTAPAPPLSLDVER